MTLLITADDIARLPISVETAIPVIEAAFREAGTGRIQNPPRTRMPVPMGYLQYQSGALIDKGVAGFKLNAHFGPGVPMVWNHLFDIGTGELLAVLHGKILGQYRTAAATGVAVKQLAPAEARVVALFGTGYQAEAQLRAVKAVREISSAVVWSRDAERRAAFCRKAATALGIEVVPGESAEAAARAADVIVTITSSASPILHGEWLDRASLVVAAGANHAHKREIDESVHVRARLVIVDDKEQAAVEGGALIWAVSRGLMSWDGVEELGHVVAGRIAPPRAGSGPIVFHSHGLAIQDVAISLAACEAARKAGVGREITL